MVTKILLVSLMVLKLSWNPPGTYSVVIQFIVDKEGSTSEINPLTHHGYGLEEEASRVIKKAPKWEPAIQNGYKVKAYRRQVITFNVLEE